jgi:hypothetical protein
VVVVERIAKLVELFTLLGVGMLEERSLQLAAALR